MFENLSQQIADKEQIDILEDNIYKLSPHLLDRLLQDKTKSTPKNPKNIVWACDEYAKYGEAYTAEKEILPELITNDNTRIIQPRISKTKDEQINRTRKSAEVFTPSWICNEMNNHCDEEWFGRKNVFNIPNGFTTSKLSFTGRVRLSCLICCANSNCSSDIIGACRPS